MSAVAEFSVVSSGEIEGRSIVKALTPISAIAVTWRDQIAWRDQESLRAFQDQARANLVEAAQNSGANAVILFEEGHLREETMVEIPEFSPFRAHYERRASGQPRGLPSRIKLIATVTGTPVILAR